MIDHFNQSYLEISHMKNSSFAINHGLEWSLKIRSLNESVEAEMLCAKLYRAELS